MKICMLPYSVHQVQIIALYTFNQFDFLMDTDLVVSEVQTKVLYAI
jgi:hypothetical protein